MVAAGDCSPESLGLWGLALQRGRGFADERRRGTPVTTAEYSLVPRTHRLGVTMSVRLGSAWPGSAEHSGEGHEAAQQIGVYPLPRTSEDEPTE